MVIMAKVHNAISPIVVTKLSCVMWYVINETSLQEDMKRNLVAIHTLTGQLYKENHTICMI
jgi:nucleoside recognition membrane protein YjiH